MIFSPRRLFLIDGLGAILSAFMLGIVLVQFESAFGIPSATLYVLAIFPVFFAIFDFYCFQKKNANLSKLLKIIAILNLLYCCMSIGCAMYHIDTVTILGWVYICVEVLLIVILSLFELKVAIKNNK
ncbi:hypothetical protein GCM10011344_18490 [Dokdonia pacifica]|uniref:Uncharacterized protein n=1 Tax=Dokdonia pacifica TaxID=1627892 RepID=A0A238VSL0_9FLAO|nr:hypothetical protein [Dokdonia pacifica]GGG18166.1 hypothetical protein GCM10011344_18490 [Dokdonia pacifica]SNR37127.1 hypothetical protein SAMN06265376_101286 [Dokdonia pacifica]